MGISRRNFLKFVGGAAASAPVIAKGELPKLPPEETIKQKKLYVDDVPVKPVSISGNAGGVGGNGSADMILVTRDIGTLYIDGDAYGTIKDISIVNNFADVSIGFYEAPKRISSGYSYVDVCVIPFDMSIYSFDLTKVHTIRYATSEYEIQFEAYVKNFTLNSYVGELITADINFSVFGNITHIT